MVPWGRWGGFVAGPSWGVISEMLRKDGRKKERKEKEKRKREEGRGGEGRENRKRAGCERCEDYGVSRFEM